MPYLRLDDVGLAETCTTALVRYQGNAVVAVAVILALGIGAQWVAWRLRVPSILLLLASGFLVGPVAGWASAQWLGQVIRLDPQSLLPGNQLLNLVSLAVALILFEGGLTLNLREIDPVRGAVWRIVTIGAVVTWIVAAVAARCLLGLDWNLSVLLGSVLIVTGPTVIGPLLRHVRPTGRVGSVLRWEGIVIDPIGAMAAVLVFELIVGGYELASGNTLWALAEGATLTIVTGTLIGAAAAAALVEAFRRYWIPDHLQVPLTLMLVLIAFVASNLLVHESGLYTTTMMGILLANQRRAHVRHIMEFKETLTTLLIGVLFVVLSARVELASLASIRWGAVLAFVAVLVVVARPASVLLSTAGTLLNRRERAFMAWMAPRGIIAASVASVFALRLSESGVAQAELIVPYVFLVIVATVLLYGSTAGLLARRLGLARPGKVGFLIVGAHALAREVGRLLTREGLEVLLIDTNLEQIREARLAGLPVMAGDALSNEASERISLSSIGRLIAMTANDQVNALCAMHFARQFGRSQVFRLAPTPRPGSAAKGGTSGESGRVLGSRELTVARLQDRIARGADFRKTRLTPEFDYKAFLDRHREAAAPIFLVTENGSVEPITPDVPISPRPGQSLISLVITDSPAGRPN